MLTSNKRYAGMLALDARLMGNIYEILDWSLMTLLCRTEKPGGKVYITPQHRDTIKEMLAKCDLGADATFYYTSELDAAVLVEESATGEKDARRAQEGASLAPQQGQPGEAGDGDPA